MDSKPKNLSPGGKLIDDLTVEILSHLPYKSFCRFKCVSTNWLSLSTDPYYRDKLPKPLTGFLYQELDSPVIKVASLCPDDGSFDTSLSFLPPYEWLELVDCCNGLVLCKYGTSTSSPFISLFVVCNPATRQWIELPETRPEEVGYYYTPKLAFNPSWSPYFYVFNFAEKCSPGERMTGITEVAIFSSRDFTWFVDDRWEPENEMTITCRPHFLLDGKFLLHTSDDRVFVVDTFYPTKEPNYSTIDLPGYKPTSPMDDCLDGCLGQSSGILHYAKPAADGCSILIWSLNGYRRGNWNLKHRLSMRDAFGQDVFIRQDCDGFWTCDYDIESFDLERGLIFLRHFPPGKLLQYSITTGELKEIRDGVSRYMYYVPHCSKFPIQETGRAEESSEP